ncbi:MAG: hypothetical protein ABR534_13570 [Desulfotignum sp.]|nr:hypothetical protein [Desulfobacteraceae bacterium]
MKNPKTKQLSDDREFPGNYLKIIRPEGEIDFILAANITDAFCQTHDFEGGRIDIETLEEIIVFPSAEESRHVQWSFPVDLMHNSRHGLILT